MDNLFDLKYIEKCINNPDLQNLWFPEYGNYFYCERVKKVRFFEPFSGFYPIKVEKDYYLPRQDELQILLKQKIDRYKGMNDLKFDFNMRQCINKLYCCKILSILTLNEMWLIFFMMEMFGKHWIPERKTWEKR